MAAIALLGTLDTKGDEFDWLRHRILTNGSQVVIIDVGSFSNSRIADWIPQAPGFHDGFRRCQPLRGTNRRHTYVLRR